MAGYRVYSAWCGVQWPGTGCTVRGVVFNGQVQCVVWCSMAGYSAWCGVQWPGTVRGVVFNGRVQCVVWCLMARYSAWCGV